MSEPLVLQIGDFQGPLDLLWHLIKEYQMDINDIPMQALTQQYLDYLHSMQELELEIAGEYLVMAASLLEIKARMLLPKPKVEAEEEEVEDPREELVDQLLEYQQIQENAKLLAQLNQERAQHYSKAASDLSGLQASLPLEEGQVTTQDLWNALRKLAQKSLSKRPIQANIQHEAYSVEEMMESIWQKIMADDQKQIAFEECFPELTRPAIVSSFLAILQLAREHKIGFLQEATYHQILLKKL